MICSARTAASGRVGTGLGIGTGLGAGSALEHGLAFALALLIASAGASFAGPSGDDTPGATAIPAIAPSVAANIAREWNAQGENIRLQWGHGAERITPDASFHLVGKGTDGWFALSWKGGAGTSLFSGAVRVRAGCVDTLFVAARPLDPGTRIADGDIRPEIRVRWGPPSSLHVARPGRDWEIRRSLATGDVVAWPAAVPPPVILKGEEVHMEWQRGDVAVTLTGVSMNAARMGETVRVRVSGRRLPLVGKAVAPGRALLVMGGSQ